MQEKMLSIVIVDDARFSTTVVQRALTQAGYTDLRTARSGNDALNLLDERPADILVADWLMPEMDGLVLTRRVRQLDEVLNRYTYVILLTAKEGTGALQQAFDEGVDDFVHKSSMAEEMLPRIMAGERLAMRHNRLLNDNQRLIDANGRLRKQTSLDPLTGMDTAPQLVRRLANVLKQCEKRGGRCALVLLHIDNFKSLKAERKTSILQQILLAFSRRLTQLVRPMDILGRIDMETFALVTYQDNNSRLTPGSFKRLYDHLNHKAFKTAGGFVSLVVSIAMSENDGRLTDAKHMLEQTHAALRRSREQASVAEIDLKPTLAAE
jgi:diguanylate cyclase (GGDEF)-like protein